MFKDNAGRRSYRKSPGRQYGYEYNPLHDGQNQADPSTLNGTWRNEAHTNHSSRPSGGLAPRPDPRRTRQLMRQNILASKSRSGVLDPFQEIDQREERRERDEAISPRAGYRVRHTPVSVDDYYPSDYQNYQEVEEEQIVEDWLKHGESVPDYMDPDLGYEEEDFLEERLQQDPRHFSTHARRTRILDERDEDELLEAELEEKRRNATRRKFLFGALAVGGTAVAAYEILPRLPQAIGNGAASIEHQLQQAFQNGVTAGANAARKELINGLDSLEGFSLEGAIEAAKLTRVAYDVFVSPLVTLAATVADDFLKVTLEALIHGRHWLAQINEDSPTLAALQTVLQSWVDQVNKMPKKIQAITDSDLDGAQSYLRALQRKIQQEQAQLNGQSTPTPGTAPHTTTPEPKK